MRRFAAIAPRTVKANAVSSSLIVQPQRQLEALSSAWIASWYMPVWWVIMVGFPFLQQEWWNPRFMVAKIPLYHFITEKKTEAKLRRVLDETYTTWSNEIESGRIDEAISRTF